MINRVPDREDVVSDSTIGSVIGRPNLRVLPGETAEVACTAKGSPNPTISWNRNGESIGESGRARVLANGVLQVTDLQEAETYTCVASNDYGDDRETMTLEPAGTTVTTRVSLHVFYSMVNGIS